MIQNPAYYQLVLDTLSTALRYHPQGASSRITGKNRRCRAPIFVDSLERHLPEVRSSVSQALGQLILNEAYILEFLHHVR